MVIGGEEKKGPLGKAKEVLLQGTYPPSPKKRHIGS